MIFRFAFFRISFTKVNLINTKTTPATMFDFVIIFASRVFLYIRWVLVWFLVFGQKIIIINLATGGSVVVVVAFVGGAAKLASHNHTQIH